MASASQTMKSVCPLIETAARLSAEKDAIGWWLMLETSSRIDNPSFRWGAWMVFFVNSSLSIWAYSRYIVQSVDLASKGRTEVG
jgi:hypothetical protein